MGGLNRSEAALYFFREIAWHMADAGEGGTFNAAAFFPIPAFAGAIALPVFVHAARAVGPSIRRAF